MSTAKFRNMISNYNRFVPSPKSRWNDIYDQTLMSRQQGKGLREPLKEATPTEDVLIREMIDNIDFFLLYRSVEFRKKLRERLDYYEGRKV